jgi:hypothetical protein
MNTFRQPFSTPGARPASAIRLVAGLLLLWLAAPLPDASGGFSQVLGSFPEISGGFEDEAVTETMPIASSIAANVVSTNWTVKDNTGTGAIRFPGGRSGPKYLTFGAVTGRRLQSPSTAYGAILSYTSYVVQFYYRTSDPVGTEFTGQVGVGTDGTTHLGSYANSTAGSTGGNWVKFATSVNSNSGSSYWGLVALRFSDAGGVDVDIDDVVVYPGAQVDTTPPDPPASLTVGGPGTNSLALAWAAPATGVDGGGYLVARGTNDPVALPNTNGIYAVGNAVGSGVGSGTVVYLGTNTTFTDARLEAGRTYYYRVYTADKAFNYSSAAPGSGTTKGSAAGANPTLLPVQFSGSDVIVSVVGASGGAYVLESATNLPGQWTNVATVSIPAGTNTARYIHAGAKKPKGFYRARPAP